MVAVPSAYLRETLEAIADRLPPGVPVLSVVKGIENQTFARPSRIIVEALAARPVAVLSGPSHAEEFARGLPASVVVAGDDERLCVGRPRRTEPGDVPGLHQPRRARGRAGRGLEEHPRDRRGGVRRARPGR